MLLSKKFLLNPAQRLQDFTLMKQCMRYAKFPGCIKDDNLRLKSMKISDGAFVSRGLRNKAVLKATGLNKSISASWLSIWWWFKRTYNCSFCIELKSMPIGFIGLYNMKPGESADISLVIFDEKFRRHGYGSKAFRLLVQSLQRLSVAGKILVKVRTDNYMALSFWRKSGFEETGISDGIIAMSMDLDKCSS